MPTYDGTAVGGGCERSVTITTKVGINRPVFAYCKIPLNGDNSRITSAAGVGDTEQEALRNLASDSGNRQYQIKVGEKTSDEPFL